MAAVISAVGTGMLENPLLFCSVSDPDLDWTSIKTSKLFMLFEDLHGGLKLGVLHFFNRQISVFYHQMLNVDMDPLKSLDPDTYSLNMSPECSFFSKKKMISRTLLPISVGNYEQFFRPRFLIPLIMSRFFVEDFFSR